MFWLSVLVFSYLYPLLNGNGYDGAWRCFCIVNAGLAAWAMNIVNPGPSGVQGYFNAAQVLAPVFVLLLIWMCIRGITYRAWLYLFLWYMSGYMLFTALTTKAQSCP